MRSVLLPGVLIIFLKKKKSVSNVYPRRIYRRKGSTYQAWAPSGMAKANKAVE
jgi:hypothetical protein